MKNTFAVLSFAAVLALTASASMAQPPQNAEKLSKQQLTSLIATAKTPAEHTRIAEYYGAKAQEDLALSQEHAQMASQFKANSVTSSSKFAPGTVNHCEYLAQRFKADAVKMQQLEQEHEQMAKEAQAR
jgi:lipoprotein-anchoring transpeptidase ErfK/SrfK